MRCECLQRRFICGSGRAGLRTIHSVNDDSGRNGADPATPAAAKAVKFEIADIHPSPPRRFLFFEGAFLENGRYIVWQATIANLITTAYGLKDSSYARVGPSWLESDRWDTIAKVPPGTTEAETKEGPVTRKARSYSLRRGRFVSRFANNRQGQATRQHIRILGEKPAKGRVADQNGRQQTKLW